MEVWHLLYIQLYIIYTACVIVKGKFFKDEDVPYTIPLSVVWVFLTAGFVFIFVWVCYYTLSRPLISEFLRYKLY